MAERYANTRLLKALRAGTFEEMNGTARGTRLYGLSLGQVALSPTRRRKTVRTRKLPNKISGVSKSYRFADRDDTILGFQKSLSRSDQAAFYDPGVHRSSRCFANDMSEVGRRVVQRPGNVRKTDPIGVVLFDEFSHPLHHGISLVGHTPMLVSGPQ